MLVSGGKALICHKLHVIILRGVIDTLQAFTDQVGVIETGKGVTKAAMSTIYKEKAKRVAETLAKERSGICQILGGLIDNKGAKAN